MLNNSKLFISVILWYLIPYVFLVIKGVTFSRVPIILFLFLTSFSFTYLLFKKHVVEKVSIININYNKFFKRVVYLSLSLSFFGLYKYYTSGGQTADIREKYFSISGGVFGNSYIYTAYDSFLSPMIILALAWFLNSKNINFLKKTIFIAFVFLIIDGFFRQGRFQYLYLIFFIILFKDVLKIKASRFILYLLVLIFLIFYTLYSRSLIKDMAIDSFLEIFDYDLIANSTINYQFYGYVYLDKLTSNLSYFGNFIDLNSFSFGFYLLNTLIFTKIGFYIEYPWESRNLELAEPIYSSVFNVDFNAFCTNFYPIYLDGGLLGIIFFGFFSGFIIAVKSSNQYVNFLKTITFFNLIFGIYQPTITYLVGFIFLIFGIIFVFKNCIKIFK